MLPNTGRVVDTGKAKQRHLEARLATLWVGVRNMEGNIQGGGRGRELREREAREGDIQHR